MEVAICISKFEGQIKYQPIDKKMTQNVEVMGLWQLTTSCAVVPRLSAMTELPGSKYTF